MKKTKLIPFDVQKAKDGAKIVTGDGWEVRIPVFDRKLKDYPILALIDFKGIEEVFSYTIEGYYFKDNPDDERNLFIEEV